MAKAISSLFDKLVGLSIIGLTLVMIITPNVFILKKLATLAVPYMFVLLLVGLIYLVISKKRLMFLSFAACAVMNLYFKFASDITIRPPEITEEPRVTLFLVDMNTFPESWKENEFTLKNVDADLIAIPNYTPDWDFYFQKSLAEKYPFVQRNVRIDDFGMAIFSKFDLDAANIESIQRKPHLRTGVIDQSLRSIKLCMLHTDPPLYKNSFLKLRSQLDSLSKCIGQSNMPLLTFGNFHLDQFSEEIQDFRAKAKLKDSRTSTIPALIPPTHHIFFNDQLECIRFENIYNQKAEKIGIMGEYQYIKGYGLAKRTETL